MINYADVFSKDDTDLGCFTTVKHDMGNAKLIRQNMCRTPLGFEEEDEGLLAYRAPLLNLEIRKKNLKRIKNSKCACYIL